MVIYKCYLQLSLIIQFKEKAKEITLEITFINWIYYG